MRGIGWRGGGAPVLRSVLRSVPATVPATAERVPDLLGPLEAEIGAAKHQKRRDRPGREGREQERHRQQEHQLVHERAPGDLPDDRKFALRVYAFHILRRDRGIVDHHARHLAARLGRLGGDIVQRSGGRLGQRRHVIKKGEKSAHAVRCPFLPVSGCARSLLRPQMTRKPPRWQWCIPPRGRALARLRDKNNSPQARKRLKTGPKQGQPAGNGA